MIKTPTGFSIWFITCVSIGLFLHYMDYGDPLALVKTALTFAVIMLVGMTGYWLWKKRHP